MCDGLTLVYDDESGTWGEAPETYGSIAFDTQEAFEEAVNVLKNYKELETKHLIECGMIAHYDNDVKHLCLIIQDRIAYVTDYSKGILEGKYSDSYEYNKGYCTALNDILDMIHEIMENKEK